MSFISLLLLFLVGYLIYRSLPLIVHLYRIFKMQKKFREQFAEQQERRQQASEQPHSQRDDDDDASSVERMREANLDLNGGEYVDYEEIPKEK